MCVDNYFCINIHLQKIKEIYFQLGAISLFHLVNKILKKFQFFVIKLKKSFFFHNIYFFT